MSLDRYFILAGVFAVGSLLALVEAQAQQKQVSEATQQLATTGANGQPLNHDRLNSANELFVSKGGIDVTPGDATRSHETESGPIEPEAATRSLSDATAPLSFANPVKLTPLDEAYLDAFSILRSDNACSRFYGGPPAIEALNRLRLQITPTYLDRSTALRMRGTTSLNLNQSSGFSYRLFEKAELNLNGPFYRAGVFLNELGDIRIGGFAPNTREARVTILLHELGHLVKADKGWLLPDDGSQVGVSRQNTERVIAVCGEQIRGLSRINFAQEMRNAQAPLASKSFAFANASAFLP